MQRLPEQVDQLDMGFVADQVGGVVGRNFENQLIRTADLMLPLRRRQKVLTIENRQILDLSQWDRAEEFPHF